MSKNSNVATSFVAEKNEQWNKAGKRIKKGESALLLWAKPKKINTHNPNTQTEPMNEDDMMNFFPLCFVFSNLQLQEDKL